MSGAPTAALRQVWFRPRGVSRRWHSPPPEPVLRGVLLTVAVGETVTLLADDPTAVDAVVALLAGLAAPQTGVVELAGRDVAAVPAERRGVAVVHRGLGLFERLSVAGNAGFCGATPRAVTAMLRLAGLEAQAGLRPAALSASGRVRLALARALLRRSPLLVLHDTLAGLDDDARVSVCRFVAAARAEREFAILHASADPGAAFCGLGTERMVVLIGAAVAQEGVPRLVYDTPATASVAALTGAINLLPGTVVQAFEDEVLVALAPGVVVPARVPEAEIAGGSACLVGVRPERIALATASVGASALAGLGEGALAATVSEVGFRRDGWRVRLHLTGPGQDLLVDRPAGVPLGGLRAGAGVAVAWQAHHATAFRVEAAPPGALGAAVAPLPAGRYPAAARTSPLPMPDATPFNLQERPR